MVPLLLRVYPIVLVLVVAYLVLYQILWAPNEFEGDRMIVISKGMSFSRVVDSLENAGIIRNRRLFELAGEILGLTKKIHVGKYLFHSGMSNEEILEDLRSGKSVLLISVTIREGLSVRTHAAVFSRELGVDSARFAELAYNESFTRSLGFEASSLEGYLLPDTYMFYWQTDEEHILRRMVDAFKKFFTDSLQLHASSLGMTTHEIVTIASIVEGEATLDNERPIIAGVYYNRLRKRMRLEADPTVQYILEGGPRKVLYRDLRIESPYNTYRNYGLPPGPINNPGRASILAALFPEKNNYLYFVANGQGGHTFSRTYTEHQRAVLEFRRMRAQMRAQQSEQSVQ